MLKGCRNAAVFIIGTGVGGGLIIDGKLVRGRDWHGRRVQLYEHQRRCLERPHKERCLPVQYQRPVERLPRPQGLPADAPMDGRIFFEAVHAGETEANETCAASAGPLPCRSTT